MPKTILLKDINRMFPFEFYDELTDGLVGITIQNPAFIYKLLNPNDPHIVKPTHEECKNTYYAHMMKTTHLMQPILDNNILEVEPFGEVLLLNTITNTDAVISMLNKENDPLTRSQDKLSFLFVQLYDSSDLPVFSKQVLQESITQIPEILIDDPNLLIGVVELNESETIANVIKIPKRIESKITEDIDNEQDPMNSEINKTHLKELEKEHGELLT